MVAGRRGSIPRCTERDEGMMKCPLYKRFDLVFGTSTGAIIAALIALGYE